MKIYDISQEVFSCCVYPGDSVPGFNREKTIDQGDGYNLTSFHMCAHNGTHIDAPFHFLESGNAVNDIPLQKFVGPCVVVYHDGEFTEYHAMELIKDNSVKRILIGGNATVTASAAKVFADNEIYLLGNESQTVGPEQSPMEVHKILLSKDVVLLEGIRLSGVKSGEYFLFAAPINIAGSDGAPCRAVLVNFDD